MPENSVAPESSVYTVSGGVGSVGRPTNPTPTAAARANALNGGGREVNFSAGTISDAGSKVSSNGTAARKFTTNGDVRIPLHPSEPREDDARGRQLHSA